MVREGVLTVCAGALLIRARLRFRGYVRGGLV